MKKQLLNKWEMNFVLILIILLVLATILELDVSFDQIFTLPISKLIPCS